MARSNNDLTLAIGFDIDKFRNELGKTNSALTKWAGGITSSLKGVAAGFSAIAIGRFVLDISRLAGEAEGVSAAFKKLEGSAKLMTDLKNATGGTVSELELMKRAVMASNFDISLKALPQLLEFATLRARQTGQSVDYLVDSIVTGIGRKSKLILDNLGISAVQLTEALGGASAASSTIGEVAEAVGRIASKNLEKMGKLTDDAAVRAGQLAANWENLKVSLGELVNNAGLSDLIKKTGELVNLMNILGGGKTNDPLQSLKFGLDVVNKAIKDNDKETYFKFFSSVQDLAKQSGKELIRMQDAATGVVKILIKENPVNFIDGTKIEKDVRSVDFLNEKIKLLNEEIGKATTPLEVSGYRKEIEAIQRELDKLMGKQKEAFSPDALFIAGKVGALKSKSPMESMQGQAAPKIAGLNTDGIEAMKKTLEELTKVSKAGQEQWDSALKNFNENALRTANSAAIMGDSIGNAIGGLVSGTEDFAHTMAQAARQIVSNLERIALAYMIANSAKFGPVGIAMAAVGFGVIKALFNQIGSDSADSGGFSRRDQRWMKDQNTLNGGNVRFILEGDKLVGAINNHNRITRRTGTS